MRLVEVLTLPRSAAVPVLPREGSGAIRIARAQVLSVGTGGDLTPAWAVFDALDLDGATGASIQTVVMRLDSGGNTKLRLLVEFSNDRDNWTSDGGSEIIVEAGAPLHVVEGVRSRWLRISYVLTTSFFGTRRAVFGAVVSAG